MDATPDTPGSKQAAAPGLHLTARAPLLVLGFVLTVLAASWYARANGYVLLEPRSNPRKAQTLYAYTSRAEREDVLVIGSSRVAGGLDGRILEERLCAELGDPSLDVYKLGLAGLRPWQLHRLLREGVALRPPKRLLVIAIETRFFLIPRGARRGADDADPLGPGEPGEPDGQDEPGDVRGEWEADVIESDLWDVFRGVESLWQLDWRLAADTQRQRRFQEENDGEGMTVAAREQREAKQQRAREGDDVLLETTAWDWSPPDGPDLVGFRRCLDELAALPCRTIFVRMPLEEGFDAEHMPAEHARFDAEIVPALESRGFAYFDLNAPPWPRDPRFFMSKTHLNRAGCERTSRLLVTELLAPLLGEDASR